MKRKTFQKAASIIMSLALLLTTLPLSAAVTASAADTLPTVSPITWDFNTASKGLDSWAAGGTYDYPTTSVTPAYDSSVGTGAIILPMDYTAKASSGWSEVKIQNYVKNSIGSVKLKGYNDVTFDFIYDPAKMTKGSFKAKLYMNNAANDVVDKNIDINLSKAVDIGGGLKKAAADIRFDTQDITIENVILSVIGCNTDYKGNIYIDNIQLCQYVAPSLPAVSPVSWNFDNSGNGLDSWKAGGVWDYPDAAIAPSYDSTVGTGSLKLSVDYSPKASSGWSEVKLQNYVKDSIGSIKLNGYNDVNFDFIYDPTKMTKGSFKTKLWMDNAAKDSVSKDTDISLSNAVDIGGGLKKVTADIKFTTQDIAIDNVMLSVIGCNTDYKGNLYIDNIQLCQYIAPDGYVTKTAVPVDKTPVALSSFTAPSTVTLADANATSSTASLYSYLLGVGNSDYVLYGHQNDSHHKVGFAQGSNSDTKDVTGQYPAIFGIDALSLTGAELSLDKNDTRDLVTASADISIDAAKQGGIVTLSAHMPNFAKVAAKGETNGQYDYSGYSPNDTSGNVVTRILPGGDLNKVYTGYLDMIAKYGQLLADKNIPVLFRPFHENNGSWFWWGASFCKASEYKNLYRYTVEYLRDVKNIHNFLYVYSPNGPFASEEDYLSRYPGDDFVDVAAFDMYHDNPTPDDKWIDSFKSTINLVQGVAQKHNKLATVSETGMRVMTSLGDGENYQGLAKTGNLRKDWFNEVLNAVSPSKMAYFMVWANFDETNFSAPYMASSTRGQDMINNFINFYNDNKSIFANSVSDYKSLKVSVAPAASYAYITAPATYSRMVAPTTIKAKSSGVTGNVDFVIKNAAGSVVKTVSAKPGTDGICTADITKADLQKIGKTIGTVELYIGSAMKDSITVLFNMPEPKPDLSVVDNFEAYYGENSLLQAAWTTNVGSGCSVSAQSTSKKGQLNSGTYGLAFHYHVSTALVSEGWAGIVKTMNGVNWSNYQALQFWFTPDGKNQKFIVQIKSGNEEFEANLTNLVSGTKPQLVTIPFSKFVGKNNGKFDPSNIQHFAIYCNTIVPKGHTGEWTVDSTLYFDDIKAVKFQPANKITIDTKIYNLAPKNIYDIGVKLAGSNTKGVQIKAYSSRDGIAMLTKLPNGNYRIKGIKSGTAYIIFEVVKGGKVITHASIKATVTAGIKQYGTAARSTSYFD